MWDVTNDWELSQSISTFIKSLADYLGATDLVKYHWILASIIQHDAMSNHLFPYRFFDRIPRNLLHT